MMDWLQDLLEQVGLPTDGRLWFWGAVLTVVTFVGSLVIVTIALIKLPRTYFCRECSRKPAWVEQHPILRWTLLFLKNVLGLALVIMGLVMLVTPGQGILTILMGIMLLNFPGKRRLERYLVSRPGVLRTINRLRARFGKPRLVLELEPTAQEKKEPGEVR